MATLADLARQLTPLDRDQVGHLQRLVAEWGLLADLCFADLLLFAPCTEPAGKNRRFVILDQIRPTTSQTIHHRDWVGDTVIEAERPMVRDALQQGEIVEGHLGGPDRVRVVAIPVRAGRQVIAVLTREWSPVVGRHQGELERTYLQAFDRFAEMIAAGTFPYRQERISTSAPPRVGDGVLVFDRHRHVTYASPNAVSALHRIGVQANVVGLCLTDVGVDDAPVRAALETGAPVTEEIEPAPDVSVLIRCLPFIADGGVTGALALVRDVTELRRRDRLLSSKDAMIREIHHRVKNNLQTISSLLRLQGRRLASVEAKDAIEESVRRIGTIALVHETLSRDVRDDVPFDEILRPLARMVEEGLQSHERPVRITVRGARPRLPSIVATPLAVVLTELLQNSVEHGFVGGAHGSVWVDLHEAPGELVVVVADDGCGLPPDFSLDESASLGLSIVRTLVEHELAGSIALTPRPGGGTEVTLRVPLVPERDDGPGEGAIDWKLGS